MIVEHGTLIVAADGGGAMIYRNASHDGVAKLELVETHDARHTTFTRATGAETHGEYAAPAGGRTAIAGHDYHAQSERAFAKRLASRIDELIGPHAHGKTQPGLVLFASPHFMGMIRQDYSARTKAALKAEIGKDLRASDLKHVEQALNAAGHA